MGAIINAFLWDAWAKVEKNPCVNLLVDMTPQKLVDTIDWRYMEDALTRDEALEILNEKSHEHRDLEIKMQQKGT